jgi:hypothetical protein
VSMPTLGFPHELMRTEQNTAMAYGQK